MPNSHGPRRSLKAVDDSPEYRGWLQDNAAAEAEESYSREFPDHPPNPTSLKARVLSKQVDLVTASEQGVPPREWLPACEGLLVPGKRHLIAAPAKAGKSIGMLVLCVDICLSGGTAAIADRENGQDEYARRLDSIMNARQLEPAQRDMLSERLDYYEFPCSPAATATT